MQYTFKAKQVGPIIYGLSIGFKLKLTGSATVEATAEIENAENGIATWKSVSFNASGESYVTAQNAAVRVTATTDCTLTVTEGTERELTEYRIGSDVTSPGKSVSSVVDPVTGRVRFSVQMPPSLGNTRAAAIGDSITQGDNDNTNDVVGNSWFEALCLASGGRIVRVRNAGIAGETTGQMLARLNTDVIAYSPSICFIQGGTNDAGNSVPIATTMANIAAMCDALVLAGVEPILCLIPPRNSYQSQVELINIRIASYAKARGLRLIDAWRSFAQPDGGWAGGAINSADGTHPTMLCNYSAAADILTQLTVPNSTAWLPRNNSDTNGIIATNTLFVTDSNSDGLPDSWIKYGAAVTPALVAGSGAVTGNWFQITFAGITGAAVVERSIPLSGYAVGDKLAVVCRIKTSGFNSKAKVSLKLGFDTANKQIVPVGGLTQNIADSYVYAERVVPAGTTGMTLQILPNSTDGSAASGVVSVAQLQIYNLTALGMA